MKDRPKISMGWLDLDQNWAEQLLAHFGEDDTEEKTLDELGFGILRDAFANVFFPATSTIMTRARYLLFIPAMFRIVEKEKLTGKAAENRCKGLEKELRKALGNINGVIGRKNPNRFSPGIYWSALRRLSIFQQNLNMLRYRETLREYYAATQAAKDEDGNLHVQEIEPNWDEKLFNLLDEGQSCLMKDKGEDIWASPMSFSLTQAEAEYLKDKYQTLPPLGYSSILGHLLDKPIVGRLDYPWDVDVLDRLPNELKRLVEQARLLSMMAQGATLQYCHLVQREKDRDNPEAERGDCDWPDLFKEWWNESRKDLSDWQVEDLGDAANKIGVTQGKFDFDFIRDWLHLYRRATTSKQMLENKAASELIQGREKNMRGSKARLGNRSNVANWEPPKTKQRGQLYALDYRARIGFSFVRDIVEGLHRESNV